MGEVVASLVFSMGSDSIDLCDGELELVLQSKSMESDPIEKINM
jgi:hypothetical protein